MHALSIAKDLTLTQVLKQSVALYQLQHHEAIHGPMPQLSSSPPPKIDDLTNDHCVEKMAEAMWDHNDEDETPRWKALDPHMDKELMNQFRSMARVGIATAYQAAISK